MSQDFRTRSTTATVYDTLAALRTALENRGLTVFAVIDHSLAAEGAGLVLAPEAVVIFGNPAVGTYLMQADPRVGIALPLRILIWEQGGVTALGYFDPLSLVDEFDLDRERPRLQQMSELLEQLVTEAA